MSNDYYNILKVNKNSTVSEIKKSYYNLAKKYHPDKAPPNKKEKYTLKFQKIAEAYETLSDENKRKIYDINYKGKIAENINPYDIFSDIFGKNYTFNLPKKKIEKAKPNIHTVSIDLEDIFKGFTINLKIMRKIIFLRESKTPCSIEELNKSWDECCSCSGIGNILEIKRYNFLSQNLIKCEKCNGLGFVLKNNYHLKENEVTLNIKINPGIGIDSQHVISDFGNCFPGKYPGDIIVIFEINPHSIYKVEGTNLTINKEIFLYDALCGVDFILDHVDGTPLRIKIDDIIKPGGKEVIKGKGIYDKFGKRGDLFINLDIHFPKKIDIEDREILRKILRN